MANVIISGYENGDTTEINATSGSFAIESTTKKTGSYSIRINPTTTGTGYAQMGAFNSGGALSNSLGGSSPQVAGFWFYVVTLPASASEEICTFYNSAGTLQAAMRITSGGKLQIYDSDGTTQSSGSSDSTATLSTATWYHIEMYCTAGTAGSQTGRIYIDGSLDVSTTTGTYATASSNYDIVRLGKVTDRNSQTVDFIYDDFYRGDTTLAANKPTILAMHPDANGTYTAFSGGTGSSDYQEVDEVTPDGVTTYIQSTAANTASTFNFQSTATVGISGTIHTAQVHVVGIRVGIGNLHDTRVRSGGTDYDYADTAWAGAYSLRGQCLNADPNTSVAWTTSGLDAVELGTEETASSTNRIRVSTYWISALFTAAAGGGQPTIRRFGGIPYAAGQMEGVW